jgi:5-methylthioadenosine/S-adenosylhomocysteine deaminase
MDPALLNAEAALQMATINGARALRLENIGMLREGWKADIIGLNTNKPHLVPLHNPLAHIVYAASASDVEYVIVDGELLLENGELKKMDEEKVIFETTKHAQRLVEASKKK